MLKDYSKLAFRNLKKRSLRSWLTLLGIFIGIAAVVSLISLGEGLEEAITGQFSSAGADKLTIQAKGSIFGPPGSTVVKRLQEKDFKAVAALKEMDIVTRRFLRITSAEYNEIKEFGFLVSLPEASDERQMTLTVLGLKVAKGRMLEADENRILLGNNFLTNDIFDKNIKLGTKLLINDKEFKVVGFLEKVSNPQFNSVIFMNEEPMKDLIGIDDEIDIIVGKVKSIEKIDQTRLEIEKVLRKTRNVKKGQEDFAIETPQQAAESFGAILGLIQAVVVGLASISLMVGGIGIANTMFTAVLERRKEIGIMKAVGATNNTIMLLFLLESGSLGFLGGIIGVILGIGFTEFVVFVGGTILGSGLLHAQYSSTVIIGSLFFGFFVGTISGIIPARQAAGLSPVEAIRS